MGLPDDELHRRPMTDLGWHVGEVIVGDDSGFRALARWNSWDYVWIDVRRDEYPLEVAIVPTWWARPAGSARHDEIVAEAVADRLMARLDPVLPTGLREKVKAALRSAALEGYGTAIGEAIQAAGMGDAHNAIAHYALHGEHRDDAFDEAMSDLRPIGH